MEYEKLTATCQECGTTIIAGDKFCSNCGSEVVKIINNCAECGNKISASDKFCGNCGSEINRAQNDAPSQYADKDIRLEKLSKAKNNRIEYFSISTRKLAILSVATSGIYQLYWFYKNWKAVKEQGREKISPFWRMIFTVFFTLGLFERVLYSSKRVGYEAGYNPLVLTVIYLIIVYTARLSDPYWLLSYLSFIPLLWVQEAINYNNSKVVRNYEENDKLSSWELLVSVIGGIIFILVIVGSFN